MLLAQLTDLHLGASSPAGDDPAVAVAAAVAAVDELRPRPDAVLITGDLTEHGDRTEYARAAALLAGLPAPVHVLPGNHDDRDALRAAFPLDATSDASPGSSEPANGCTRLG